MQLGMIGLGRTGGNMVRRLMNGGHLGVAFDTLDAKKVHELEAIGSRGALVVNRPWPRSGNRGLHGEQLMKTAWYDVGKSPRSAGSLAS